MRLWPALLLLLASLLLWPQTAMAGAGTPCDKIIDVGLLASSDTGQRDDIEHYLAFQKALFGELTDRTGCRFNLMADMPRARQLQLYLAGHLAIVSGAIATATRDAVGWYVKLHRGRNVLVLRNDHAAVDTLAAILGNPHLTIGIVRGYTLGAFWDDQIKAATTRAQIDQFTNIRAIFHLLESGRVDAVITNDTVYGDLLPVAHLTGRVTILDPPGNRDFYTGIYLSHLALTPDIAELIGRAIESMHEDGSLARVYESTTQAGTGDLFHFTAAPVDYRSCQSGQTPCQATTN